MANAFREVVVIAVMPLLLGLTERVTEIDLRETDDSTYAIAFFARHETTGSLRGSAFMMIGEGTDAAGFKSRDAYGLHLVPGRMRLGRVSVEEIEAVRAFEPTGAAPPPEFFFVRIDASDHAEILRLIEEWSAKETYDYPIETEFAHFSEKVFKASVLYPPYRAAFRPFNPIEYYVDLRRLNENAGRPPQREGPAPE